MRRNIAASNFPFIQFRFRNDVGSMLRYPLFISLWICASLFSLYDVVIGQSAQDTLKLKRDTTPTTLAEQVDFSDFFHKLFHTIPKDQQETTSSFALLPVLGYNPSFGFVLGAKINLGKQFGDPATTDYSIYSLNAFLSTNGIVTFQARHNVFTRENKWNYQGNWQISRFGLVDYGLGVHHIEGAGGIFDVGNFPTTNPDSAYPIQYKYIRLNEKGFKNIAPNLYVGFGVSFDIYSNIQDIKLDSTDYTPHYQYSIEKGMNTGHYSANGFLLSFQYNTRDHPLRAYKGIYAELGFRLNQTWMGSSRNSTQFQYDLRKYWSLSKRNPEHVIAIWLWGSYRLGGTIPYLELPNTASDVYNRVGEAYPLGRFRGPSYAFAETDYRFPITRNKFISGVFFVNFQSASDGAGAKLYESWALGEGIGIRILFDKVSRTTLCVDFAKGNYGSSGIYSGLGEIF